MHRHRLKRVWRIDDAKFLVDVMPRALNVAQTGRPGVVPAFPALTGVLSVPGFDINPMMILHGEQYTEVLCDEVPTRAAWAERTDGDAGPQVAKKDAVDGGEQNLYTVVEGNKVDARTFGGFKAWREGAVDQESMDL